MKIRFSLRALFVLPVVLLLVLRLAININVEMPKKWPVERWNMNLIDGSGKVLSSQDETWNYISGPTLTEGTYTVRQEFPGLLDCCINSFATSRMVGVGVHLCADEKPMKIVDQKSGKTVQVFAHRGTEGFRLQPGHYAVEPMTSKEIAEWNLLEQKELAELNL